MSFTTTALIASWAAIAVLAFAMAGILQQLRALRADGRTGDRGSGFGFGPPVGSPAPPLDARGEPLPGPALVLFAAENCVPCQRVVPAFAALEVDAGLVVVHRDEPAADLPGDVEQTAGEDVFRRWNVTVTPFCVAVDADGRVAAAAPAGRPEALLPVAHSIEPRRDVARTA